MSELYQDAAAQSVLQKTKEILSLMYGKPVSLLMYALEDDVEEIMLKRDLLVRRIICEACGVDWHKVTSPTRKREVVRARQLYCYYAKRFLGMSLKRIGDNIGMRDHTTVLHSLRTVKDLVDTADPTILPHMDNITPKIKAVLYES